MKIGIEQKPTPFGIIEIQVFSSKDFNSELSNAQHRLVISPNYENPTKIRKNQNFQC
ncbi:MAG: hypothetical protein AB7P49_19175 [Bdellovibrionales bacterium]